MSINIGSRSSGLVQCWGKISFCSIDRLTAVATTVIVTAAVTVLVTATVTVSVSVTGTVPAVVGFATASVRVPVTVENKKQLGPQPPPPPHGSADSCLAGRIGDDANFV